MMPDNEMALSAEVIKVFREIHGNVLFTLDFVSEIVGIPGCSTFGVCDFSMSPPAVLIRAGLSETDLVENLCHELAHLVAGYAADHNQIWESTRNELSIRFWARSFQA